MSACGTGYKSAWIEYSQERIKSKIRFRRAASCGISTTHRGARPRPTIAAINDRYRYSFRRSNGMLMNTSEAVDRRATSPGYFLRRDALRTAVDRAGLAVSREAAELRRAPLCRPPNLRLRWRRTLERARLGSSPFKNPDTKALISFSADFETPYFSAVSSTLSGAGGALSILKGRAATLGS